MNRTESNSPSQFSCLQSLLEWTDTNPEVLIRRSRLAADDRPTGIWTGHSTFQIPLRLLEYAGQSPVHLALLLYSQGAGVSYRSPDWGNDVSFPSRIASRAKVSGLSARVVRSAFKRLETDGYISMRSNGNTDAGRYRARKIFLLDPQTGERLTTNPGIYGLFSSNATDEHFHFITVPRTSLEAVNAMEHASAKSAYLVALCFVSKAMDECVAVNRSLWQRLSHLGRNAFGRGLRYCIRKGLLSYRRGVLTVNDPATGKPTERWKHPRVRIEHENPVWKFDLNTVKPEKWRIVVEELLHASFPETDGWTHSTKDVGCPFCGEFGKFNVNFSESRYKCHASGCRESGRLGQLVQRVHRTTMDAAKTFIQEKIREEERVAV